MRKALIPMLMLGLAACGDSGPLRPKEGHSLPPRPATASKTPSASDLLTPPSYARPERVDELVKRSTPRDPDPFDLPPAEGGAAPNMASDGVADNRADEEENEPE